MTRTRSKCASLILALALIMGAGAPAYAVGSGLDAAAAQTAQYLYKTVSAPGVGSVGGDWAVMGLARSGAAAPNGYFDGYYAAVVKYVKACGGALSTNKHTEYSRVVLALSAIGRDARNVGGYDLIAPLLSFDKTVKQGLNGAVFALIALDSRNYAADKAPRDSYIKYILSRALPGGGWTVSGTAPDPDMTAMALQALAKYRDRADVKAAAEGAVSVLSAMQSADGGFAAYGAETSESASQVVTALCELGINPADARFTKNGRSVLDKLLSFALPGGGFAHTAGTGANQMATEQAMYALAAAKRLAGGGDSLYQMSDAGPAIAVPPVKYPGRTFSDIASDANLAAIEALAARGIVSGKGNGLFDPGANVTRAEYAAMIVRALGLNAAAAGAFSDVAAGSWYSAPVDTAASYGIVSGIGGGKFNPVGAITLQEAALMTAKAAKLCLAGWNGASASKTPASRSQTAAMIYAMLSSGKLI